MSDKTKFATNERKTLHKERASTGTHNYFFEVKEANNGSKYIVIDQARRVQTGFESVKMRIFEDEVLEFQRILQKMIRAVLNDEASTSKAETNAIDHAKDLSSELRPTFFDRLLTTHNWQEFEQYTHYLLKLLGIQTAYKFLGERQAGRADGFFKFRNLAVIYDCTLNLQDIEDKKRDQVINYCNRLKQGSIELAGETVEEFHDYHKQVWIITRGISRRIKLINDIPIKEVAIRDLMHIYEERLQSAVSDEALEIKLRNI
jgi:hypothetical protein